MGTEMVDEIVLSLLCFSVIVALIGLFYAAYLYRRASRLDEIFRQAREKSFRETLAALNLPPDEIEKAVKILNAGDFD